MMTIKVKNILKNYSSESPGIRTNLARILMHGKLAGTGKMVILPVDQGFEHGPDRSFAINSPAYDPCYHFELAIAAGLSAYAAPLGFLAAGVDQYIGQLPLILKLNSNNSLMSSNCPPNQSFTASVEDAIALGCSAVGLTIYPGSLDALNMFEEAKEIIAKAKEFGLPTVIWSYPRGGDLSKTGETALDICSYSAHIAALLGAHIIKVKLPSAIIENSEAQKILSKDKYNFQQMNDRIEHVVQSCFNGRRLVVFSGGAAKSVKEILAEASAINLGGGNGSIIGRNSFQRPFDEALDLLGKICNIYLDNPKN